MTLPEDESLDRTAELKVADLKTYTVPGRFHVYRCARCGHGEMADDEPSLRAAAKRHVAAAHGGAL